MTWPVAAFTPSGVAHVIAATPMRPANSHVSTGCAAEVSTRSGDPSAMKTKDLTIAPTSQPKYSAAASNVGVASSIWRTVTSMSAACSGARTWANLA